MLVELVKGGRQLLGIETVLLEGLGVPPVEVGAEVPRVAVDPVVTIEGVSIDAALGVCVDGLGIGLLEVHDLVGLEELPCEVRGHVDDVGQLTGGGLLLDLLLVAFTLLVNPLDGRAGMLLLEGFDELLEIRGEFLVLERPGLELDAALELGGKVDGCLARRLISRSVHAACAGS